MKVIAAVLVSLLIAPSTVLAQDTTIGLREGEIVQPSAGSSSGLRQSIAREAANLAEHCIKKVDVVEYADLGMEAVWKIEVENFPAFIIIDDKGNDFFAMK